MTRAAIWLFTAGALLFIGVLVSQGFSAVFATLAAAGWGLLWVALFHLLPLSFHLVLLRGNSFAQGLDILGHGRGTVCGCWPFLAG